MDAFAVSVVEGRLREWTDRTVFIHLEVNPGAYWRNGKAVLKEGYVRGAGPYRVFLKLDGGTSLIQVDDLTHMEISGDTLILIGFDEQQRLARTVEVSLRPFSMD